VTIPTILFSFIFGSALGSFSLVVADRYRVKSFFGGRSECMHCSRQLAWYENIPVFSYLFLRGRCRTCKSKLSINYLSVEVLTGLLTAILSVVVTTLTENVNYQIILFLFFSVFIVLSMVIVIYDMRHSVVPLEVVVIMLIMGLVATIVRQYFFGFNIFDFLSGVLVAIPFAILHLVSKGKWVGAGDIFVYAACGFIFSLPIGLTGFFYSVWVGAFVSLALLFLHKKEYTLKSQIPFAPFIILGMFLAFYSGSDILGLYEILYI